MKEKVNSHSSNLANFRTLISIIISFGLKYIPTRVSIQLVSLQALLPKVQVVVEKAHETDVALHKAIAVRKASYDTISSLMTKVISSLRSTESPKEIKVNAAAIVRKIRGSHLKSKTTVAMVTGNTADSTGTNAAASATTTTKKPHANTERSFNDQLTNIDKFIKLLETIPEYAPTEADITLAALQAMYNDLIDKNSAVHNAEVAYDTAKIERYNLCYTPVSGMVDLTQAVKNYVKSVYGATSPQYKEVTKLGFKNIPLS